MEQDGQAFTFINNENKGWYGFFMNFGNIAI